MNALSATTPGALFYVYAVKHSGMCFTGGRVGATGTANPALAEIQITTQLLNTVRYVICEVRTRNFFFLLVTTYARIRTKKKTSLPT